MRNVLAFSIQKERAESKKKCVCMCTIFMVFIRKSSVQYGKVVHGLRSKSSKEHQIKALETKEIPSVPSS